MKNNKNIIIAAGGDVQWSEINALDGIYTDEWKKPKSFISRLIKKILPKSDDWIPVPYIANEKSKEFLERKGVNLVKSEVYATCSRHIDQNFESDLQKYTYPFIKIRNVFLEADIAYINLETPLSNEARWIGLFRTPLQFVEGLKWAGIDVVSTANNHSLDAEGVGLIDTLEVLEKEEIGAVGTGKTLGEGRKPYIIEKNGITTAFLGYSQFKGWGYSKGFALENRSGVVPLDPFIIKEDIARIRDKVDWVVTSFHWEVEDEQRTHPEARRFAQDIIDSGADIILGHHPHVPHGVEAYKGKLIVYSLGNLIFKHNYKHWMNNLIVRVTLTKDKITRAEILPVAGKGKNLHQPYLLKDRSAIDFLENISLLSEKLDTKINIENYVGVIQI